MSGFFFFFFFFFDLVVAASNYKAGSLSSRIKAELLLCFLLFRATADGESLMRKKKMNEKLRCMIEPVYPLQTQEGRKAPRLWEPTCVIRLGPV